MTRPEETSETRPCPACRGRGTKLRSSRRALLVGESSGDHETQGEQECLDCLATGRVERNVR